MRPSRSMYVRARGPGSSVTTWGTGAVNRSTGKGVVGLGVITCSSVLVGRSRRRLPWGRRCLPRGWPPRARRDRWVERGAEGQQPRAGGTRGPGERGLVIGTDPVDRFGLDAEAPGDGDK